MDGVNNEKTAREEQELSEVLQVRREKLQELQENGRDPFQIVRYEVDHHSQEVKDAFEELEGKTVSVAGRMMSKRIMGKASFCHVQDLKGSIQIYVARDAIGEDPYKDFKKMDIGDIVGIRGEVSRRKPARFPFVPQKLCCFPRACVCSRRSITA